MNNKIDFKKLAQDFLQSGVPKQTAKDLKDSFGVPMGTATKGVLLIAALFDLAVSKGSVPAAKELLSLCSKANDEQKNDTLQSLISVLKEDNLQ